MTEEVKEKLNKDGFVGGQLMSDKDHAALLRKYHNEKRAAKLKESKAK